MNPNHTSHENQRHSRHRHHTVVYITEVVAGIGHNLKAQQTAAAQQLTNGTNNHQNHSVAQTVTYTIEERRPRLVLHGERLEATHQDTVGNDQSYIYRQLNANIVSESLQNLANDSYQRSHNYQLNHNTNAVRNGVADD